MTNSFFLDCNVFWPRLSMNFYTSFPAPFRAVSDASRAHLWSWLKEEFCLYTSFFLIYPLFLHCTFQRNGVIYAILRFQGRSFMCQTGSIHVYYTQLAFGACPQLSRMDGGIALTFLLVVYASVLEVYGPYHVHRRGWDGLSAQRMTARMSCHYWMEWFSDGTCFASV